MAEKLARYQSPRRAIRSIYADLYVKYSFRAKRSPRVNRHVKSKVLAWSGHSAFYRNRFYEIDQWYKARIHYPEKYPQLHLIDPDDFVQTLEERLKGQNVREHESINIGFVANDNGPSAEERATVKLNKHLLESPSRRLQFHADLNTLEWSAKTDKHSFLIAKHYGLFKDMFNMDAYFYPLFPLNVNYNIDGDSFITVHLGNIIMPYQTVFKPHLSFPKINEKLFWTLLMVNLDGNPFLEKQEMLHWLITNIQGNDLSSGDTLVDYVQPIPLKGSGFHRIVFLLFYQNSPKMDLKPQIQDSFASRSFSTAEFYKMNENILTPTALAFFQTKWDSTCHKCLYEKFGATHPLYKYEWPELLKPKQEEFPEEPQPFDRYFDMFLDSATVEADMLKKRLEMQTIGSRPPEKPTYPDLFWKENYYSMPPWQHKRVLLKNKADGKYASIWKNTID